MSRNEIEDKKMVRRQGVCFNMDLKQMLLYMVLSGLAHGFVPAEHMVLYTCTWFCPRTEQLDMC